MIRLLFHFIFLSVLFQSCKSQPSNSAVGTSNYIDSIQNDYQHLADIEALEQEQENYRKQFINEYAKSLTKDTSFSTVNNTYTVFLRHYCTWDSALVVLARYNFDTNAEFTTHNFQSELTVLEGLDTSFRMTITKKDFTSLLYPELTNYATLYFPTLKLKNDSIELFYSISIPVTDVGIGATIQFDTKGKYTIIQ